MQLRLSAAALALAAVAAHAQSPEVHGAGAQCLAGDCNNGVGTVRNVLGQEYTGPWRGGRFVAAEYRVRWPAAPDRVTTLTTDGDGLIVRGTQVRGLAGGIFKPSTFSGSFARVWSPFTERPLASPASGRYEDSKGVIYEGEFDYVPALSVYGNTTVTGFFVFQGVRIDPLLDEVTQGLYISDETFAGDSIRFSRARPDYIAKLQQDYRFSREKDAQQKAEESRSREMWGPLLELALGVAASGRGSKLLGLGGDRTGFNLITRVMRGAESPENALQGLAGEFQRRAGLQPDLAKLVAGADNPRDLGKVAAQLVRDQVRKMTQKEYAELLARAAAQR
jgi:hypothetical protein